MTNLLRSQIINYYPRTARVAMSPGTGSGLEEWGHYEEKVRQEGKWLGREPEHESLDLIKPVAMAIAVFQVLWAK